jgi:hypothetical protein
MTPRPLALLVLLSLAAGCGKKPASEPEVAPDPKPIPTDPAPKGLGAKADAANRLKQVGLAIHSYESATGRLPAGVVGPKGEVGLSWRVQILPYLGKDEAELYNQFDLKQPWDGEANKKLLAKMPKAFAPAGKEAAEGKTHLRSFAGPAAFVRLPPPVPVGKGKAPPPPFPHLPPGTPVPGQVFAGISDGTSGTLMVAEAADPVEWTKPDDLPFAGRGFDPKPVPLPKLGGLFPGGFHGLMCDGAVHFFPDTLPDEAVRGMITTNGGEVLPEEVSKILFAPKPKKPVPPAAVPDALPDAAARRTAVANFHKVVLGLHAHHDAMGFFPAGVVGPDKSLGLSWRVAVLPFVGEEALYKEFKLNEPWDSDHNKTLLGKMPAVFASAGKAAEKGHTFVRTTTGPGGVLRTVPAGPPAKGKPEVPPKVEVNPSSQPGQIAFGPKLTNVVDGLSNTILFVEAGEAVPWTKPDELFLPSPIDPKGGGPVLEAKLPPLGGAFADGFHAAMADGRVTFYKTGYPTGHLAKMFCPADGWVVEPLGEPDKIGYSVPPPVANPKNPAPKAGEVKTK